ncbi:F-box protein [Glycine soja]|uniref:F-box protein n=1 Tax=Glycine soja TaxID=3848 RepID=A0A445JK88_GLYSO|nr:F-box protein [Glycine soja]
MEEISLSVLFEQDRKIHVAATDSSADQIRYTLRSLFLFFVFVFFIGWTCYGGYVRAMYNISLCFSFGEGLTRNHQLARKWMKWATDCGHSKAQFEHGLALFSAVIMIFYNKGKWRATVRYVSLGKILMLV